VCRTEARYAAGDGQCRRRKLNPYFLFNGSRFRVALTDETHGLCDVDAPEASTSASNPVNSFTVD
jgi:hypothetical protein